MVWLLRVSCLQLIYGVGVQRLAVSYTDAINSDYIVRVILYSMFVSAILVCLAEKLNLINK